MKKDNIVLKIFVGLVLLGLLVSNFLTKSRLDEIEGVLNNQGVTIATQAEVVKYILQTPEISSVVSKRIEREKTQEEQ